MPLGTHFIFASSSISERTAQISAAVLRMGERESVQSNLRQPGLICQAPSLVVILQLSLAVILQLSDMAGAGAERGERQPRLSGALSVLWRFSDLPWLCCT